MHFLMWLFEHIKSIFPSSVFSFGKLSEAAPVLQNGGVADMF